MADSHIYKLLQEKWHEQKVLKKPEKSIIYPKKQYVNRKSIHFSKGRILAAIKYAAVNRKIKILILH